MIQKYQWGNPLIQTNEQQRGKVQTWGNRGIKQVGMQAKQAEEQNSQLRKADARANRKTKAPMQQNNTAILQDALWRAGAFKGIKDRKGREVTYNTAVDGISGTMTKTAMENARKMGYVINNNGSLSKMSDITGDVVKNAKQQSRQPQAKQPRRNGLAEMYGMTHAAATGGMSRLPQPAQKKYTQYTEIDPNDRQGFAEWLYNEGSKHGVSNFTDVTSALGRNFTGLGITIRPGEGTKKQAVALHLYDRNDISQHNDTINHYLGYMKGSDNYKWQQLNGGKKAHDKRGLMNRATKTPGEFLLGRFSMMETPDKYEVTNETYNFNPSGTDYAYNKVKDGTATAYDKIRHVAGTYGANKDIPVKLEVPKSQVLAWYNQYKNR